MISAEKDIKKILEEEEKVTNLIRENEKEKYRIRFELSLI